MADEKKPSTAIVSLARSKRFVRACIIDEPGQPLRLSAEHAANARGPFVPLHPAHPSKAVRS